MCVCVCVCVCARLNRRRIVSHMIKLESRLHYASCMVHRDSFRCQLACALRILFLHLRSLIQHHREYQSHYMHNRSLPTNPCLKHLPRTNGHASHNFCPVASAVLAPLGCIPSVYQGWTKIQWGGPTLGYLLFSDKSSLRSEIYIRDRFAS